MNIYHGSLETVKIPKILPRKDGHTCDFGLGFYATTDYNQAERWVKIRMKTSQNKNGFVNKYLIDDDLLQNENLKVLKFDCANESWLNFVVQNRSDRNFTHDYDVVFGKVANDNVYATIGLYEDGFLNKNETINRLKTFALVDQILFHTEKSLRYVTFLGSDRNMAEITQSNFRSLLPVKEAKVIMKIKEYKQLTLKEAYRTFFTSEIYRQLETEETKRWWQSAEEIFEDGK